jgi:hypothetical protein
MRSAVRLAALLVMVVLCAGAGVVVTVLVADAMVRAESTTTAPCAPVEVSR